MTQDYNKKSVRQFQCRDYLWEIFEQMGSELECSVDYLVNEAMRQYARSRSQSRAGTATGSQAAARPVAPPPPRAGMETGNRAAAVTGGYASSTAQPPAVTGPAVPPLVRNAPQRPAPSAPKPPPVGSMAPPPLPGAGTPASVGGAAMSSLHVIFNGQKIPVQKEEFVIGRGSKSADLPIKDGNISRRHAAVVWQDGAFFRKDLGSTNGIEFNGQRVDTRRIEDGDVYQLCDYELRFTYQ